MGYFSKRLSLLSPWRKKWSENQLEILIGFTFSPVPMISVTRYERYIWQLEINQSSQHPFFFCFSDLFLTITHGRKYLRNKSFGHVQLLCPKTNEINNRDIPFWCWEKSYQKNGGKENFGIIFAKDLPEESDKIFGKITKDENQRQHWQSVQAVKTSKNLDEVPFALWKLVKYFRWMFGSEKFLAVKKFRYSQLEPGRFKYANTRDIRCRVENHSLRMTFFFETVILSWAQK